MQTHTSSSDESGWAWFIPLHVGVTSIGVVVNKDLYARRDGSQSDEVARGTSSEGVTHGKTIHDTILQTLGTYLGISQKTPRPVPSDVSSSTKRYLDTLELAPGLKKLLGDGRLVNHLGSDDDNRSLVHTASDYSYSADGYAGDGWQVIGGAGGGWPEEVISLLC